MFVQQRSGHFTPERQGQIESNTVYLRLYNSVGDSVKTKILYVTWKIPLFTAAKRVSVRFYSRRFRVFSNFKLLHILGFIIIIHSLIAYIMHVAFRVLDIIINFCLIIILGDYYPTP